MTALKKRNPPGMAGFRKTQSRVIGSQAHSSPAQKLLPQLRSVKITGNGSWRADCPNPIHDGGKGMLAITERDDVLLLHCFGCHDAPAILGAVGLTLADLYTRPINLTPEQRRGAQQAAKRSGWIAALSVLSREGIILSIAANDLAKGNALSAPDHDRLELARDRIDGARRVLA